MGLSFSARQRSQSDTFSPVEKFLKIDKKSNGAILDGVGVKLRPGGPRYWLYSVSVLFECLIIQPTIIVLSHC